MLILDEISQLQVQRACESWWQIVLSCSPWAGSCSGLYISQRTAWAPWSECATGGASTSFLLQIMRKRINFEKY